MEIVITQLLLLINVFQPFKQVLPKIKRKVCFLFVLLAFVGRILNKNKNIPVIINTAYSNYKDNLMSWVADAYLVKSSDLSELKNKIKELIKKKGVFR